MQLASSKLLRNTLVQIQHLGCIKYYNSRDGFAVKYIKELVKIKGDHKQHFKRRHCYNCLCELRMNSLVNRMIARINCLWISVDKSEYNFTCSSHASTVWCISFTNIYNYYVSGPMLR